MKKPFVIILLSLLFLIYIMTSCRQTNTLSETEKTTNNPFITNNISNQQVNVFAEDAQGYIWIGTFRGLNKYNAHEYQQYFCNDNPDELPDNQIKDILRDSQGRLWISTVNGLCIYTDKDTFKYIPTNCSTRNGIQLLEGPDGRIFLNYTSQLAVYNPDTEEMECVISNLDPNNTLIVKCFIDNNNQLWVATPELLYCYDYATMQLKDSIIIKKDISYFYLHKDGKIWLTGSKTLLLFDTYTHKFTDTPTILTQNKMLAEAKITNIHPYNNNLILNTSNHGIFCYNYISNKIVQEKEEEFPFEVPDFQISCMFTDSKNNLWIGSVDQGYTVCYHYKKRFNNDNYLSSYFKNKSVVSVSSDKEDRTLWITTLSNGIYRYELNKRKITNISIKEIFPKAKHEAIRVNQIFVDNENNIWMTATNNEVLKCQYKNNHLNIESKYHVPYPMSIAQDQSKNILIGTATPYIYIINPYNKNIQSVKAFDTNNGSNFTFIPGLLPLKNGGTLIAAFHKPMQLINTHSLQTREFKISQTDLKLCIKRSVFIPTALYEDSQGDIWIGTVANGLLHYDPTNQKLSPVSGAACTDISGIEEDMHGNIWVSTLYGMSKYDRTTRKFTNFYENDGIGGNQFYDRSSCKLSNGTLVFGGTHGLTLFNPIDINAIHNIPLLFEHLKIHNQLVKPNTNCDVDKHLSYNPDINLKYDQNSFSISFAALDYSEYERVHYHYKLEGFDKYWIDAQNNREAYYANLPAGNYTFKVKITNNDQQAIEAENAINITISPAPWASIWAYIIYILTALGIIFLFYRTVQRIRTAKQMAKQEKLEKEQEQRVNKMNMSFFANVSHEFRTPLTMISGPITQLCSNPDIEDSNKKLLLLVKQSTDRMLRLVNQLMDFNKLENDTLKLKVRRNDIIVNLKHIIEIFKINAQSKNINFVTSGLEDTFLMWNDADKIDKIMSNLLSNALKFTPYGGQIEINFDVISGEEAKKTFCFEPNQTVYKQYIKIEVADSGIGIPQDQTERIFERYYQLNNQLTGTYNWGTGIGLYYARSLTHIHHGMLKAGNRTDIKGAVFTLILPTDDNAYKEDEQDIEQKEQEKAFPLNINQAYTETAHKDSSLKKILVVDDDTDVVHYLQILLSPNYKVISRFNAEDALIAVNKEAPDIILSDVVMPGTNGNALCSMIKEDLQLCHIPVILVTAKTNMEDQVEGLNAGADAYVTKPFNPNYLLALIHSLLKNREKVRTLLGQNTQITQITDNVLLPQDNAFMTELYQLMETELSNPELDINNMTEMLKISRTKFYYKVKGLTGETPANFFKTYKLNRAAELIKEGKYTISEIADITGFSTHSYFSKAFKKQFGVPPNEYK